MRVLLDECVTRYLKRDLPGHEVFTVDQNLQHQQNPETLPLPVIVLSAKRSTYPMLRPLMPRVLEVMEKAEAGRVVVTEA